MTLGEALRGCARRTPARRARYGGDRCGRRPRRDGAGASGLLGGVTGGGIYGAVNETAEAAVLALAVILTAGAAGALPDA